MRAIRGARKDEKGLKDKRTKDEGTRSEIQIFERTKRELESETNSEVWEKKNEALRCLGLRTIPYPNE